MYAVIESGGKQYRVEVGTELEVELLEGDPGDAITLDRVLLVADGETTAIGRPVVENASVAAEVVRRELAAKVISFKYRPKARRRVKKGHRQEHTVLRVSDIVLDGRSAAAEVAKAAEARLTERQRLEDAARRQAEADAALAAKLKPATPKAAATGKTSRTTKADAIAEPEAPETAKVAPTAKSARTRAAAKTDAEGESTASAQGPKPAPRSRAAKAEAEAGETKPKPKRARAPKKDE